MLLLGPPAFGGNRCTPMSATVRGSLVLLEELLLVDERPVEAQWHTLRHRNLCHRRARHGLGIVHL